MLRILLPLLSLVLFFAPAAAADGPTVEQLCEQALRESRAGGHLGAAETYAKAITLAQRNRDVHGEIEAAADLRRVPHLIEVVRAANLGAELPTIQDFAAVVMRHLEADRQVFATRWTYATEVLVEAATSGDDEGVAEAAEVLLEESRKAQSREDLAWLRDCAQAMVTLRSKRASKAQQRHSEQKLHKLLVDAYQARWWELATISACELAAVYVSTDRLEQARAVVQRLANETVGGYGEFTRTRKRTVTDRLLALHRQRVGHTDLLTKSQPWGAVLFREHLSKGGTTDQRDRGRPVRSVTACPVFPALKLGRAQVTQARKRVAEMNPSATLVSSQFEATGHEHIVARRKARVSTPVSAGGNIVGIGDVAVATVGPGFALVGMDGTSRGIRVMACGLSFPPGYDPAKAERPGHLPLLDPPITVAEIPSMWPVHQRWAAWHWLKPGEKRRIRRDGRVTR